MAAVTTALIVLILCSSSISATAQRAVAGTQVEEAIAALRGPPDYQSHRRALVVLHANAAKAIDEIVSLHHSGYLPTETQPILDDLLDRINRRDGR